MGEILTFYSYKGGVGRTMALANVAVLLAKYGYKVLVVDWDLEAPGLEFFFRSYFLNSTLEAVFQKEGIVDILHRVFDGELEVPIPQALNNLIVEVNFPNSSVSLHLITAGRRNQDYFAKVSDLNLETFYAKRRGGHFIEELRDYWKQQYDFVLVDSRTGITDIGGICTIQMPDILVLLFTATEQNLRGTIEIAQRTEVARQKLPFDRLSLITVPIPSKFDTTEEFKIAQEWLTRFVKGLPSIFANWLPKSVEIRDFLEIVKIPYMSYFSFGEELAVLEQGTIDPTGLGYAYETLAALMANKLRSVELLRESRSEFVRLASKTKGNIYTEPTSSSIHIQESRRVSGPNSVGLAQDLYTRMHDTLLKCTEFNSFNSLQSIFVTSDLTIYRNNLPQASTKEDQVYQTIAYLLPQRLNDGTPALPLFLATLRDRSDPHDPLYEELEELYLNSRQALGNQIIIPFIIAAMTRAEANDLMFEAVFDDPSIAPNERKAFQQFKRTLKKYGLDNLQSNYAMQRESWNPPSFPNDSISKIIFDTLDRIYDNKIQVDLPRFLPHFLSDDFFSSDQITRRQVLKQLNQGGVLIIDAISIFHPLIKRSIVQSGITGDDKIAVLVFFSPINTSTIPVNLLIEDAINRNMETLLFRVDEFLDPLCEIEVGNLRGLKRWLLNALPETAAGIQKPRPSQTKRQQLFQLRGEEPTGISRAIFRRGE